jgi:hypothetical protein
MHWKAFWTLGQSTPPLQIINGRGRFDSCNNYHCICPYMSYVNFKTLSSLPSHAPSFASSDMIWDSRLITK